MKCARFILAALLCLMNCRPAADPVRHLSYTHHAAPEANTIHIPVWVDDRLPDGLRVSLVSALSEWNTAFNGYRDFEIAAPEGDADAGVTPAQALQWRLDNQQAILFVKAASVRDADYEDGVLGWVDMTQTNTLHIVIDGLNVHADEMRTVILHEIGHTLGLEHAKEHPGTLMFPWYNNQSRCIDHYTVEVLASRLEIDDRYMNWCE